MFIDPKKCFLKVFLVFFSLLFFLNASSVKAATLYFEPDSTQVHMGDEFLVKVKIDTEGQCINAIRTGIEYDKRFLVAKQFLTGNSIISIWLRRPTINNGLILFSGGIPGGYCGKIPGDPGESGILGEIIFKVPSFLVSQKHSAKLKFSKDSDVFLNNSVATKTDVNFKTAQYEILEANNTSSVSINTKQDTTPPEPFKISILSNPQIFHGKYFLIFYTSDKQTGIDHYEVKEGDMNWVRAESPYLLKDQSLQSIIKVKAVDKAGNERISEYIHPTTIKRNGRKNLIMVVLMIFIILIIVIFVSTKRKIITYGK